MTATATTAPYRSRLGGWLGAATSTDHKRIGLNLGVCSLVFFLAGGVFALLMRSQIAQPNEHFVSDNTYNQLFTMHGSTMIYLFVTPMAIALAIYLVPLQIGAAAMAGAEVDADWFLGVAGRRPDHGVELADRRRRRPRRLVLLHAAVERHQHARRRAGPLGHGRAARRDRDVADGSVRGRDDRAPPRAGDVTAAHAGVHVDRSSPAC